MKHCAAALLLAGGCAAAPMLAGCGTTVTPSDTSPLPRALVLQSRPIGRGARFQPPVTGPIVGACRSRRGARWGVHVELFAANRVVAVPAGIGTAPPRARLSGRITAARCYGDLITLEPTGLVLVRTGRQASLAELFRAWGQPLSRRRLGPFAGTVRVFVGGFRRRGPPQTVPLTRHGVVVLEVGPYVPPHSAYRFPPGS